MRSVVRDRSRARRGAVLFEAAVVLSMLLTLLLGIFEFGHVVMLRQLMTNAVREGSRMAVVGTASAPAVTTNRIIETVNGFLAGQALQNVNIQVYQADPDTGANLGDWRTTAYGGAIAVRIDADYYEAMIPAVLGVVPNPLHLSATSLMRSEAN